MIEIKLPNGGKLVAQASTDPDYPGIYIDYIKDGQNTASYPSVLMEYNPDKKLRALIWANPDSEDYSEEIEFNIGG